MTSSMDTFFKRNAGGGGAPAFKFAANGTGVFGEITDLFEGFVTIKGTSDPKLDKNQQKQPQLVVTLQTELRDWAGLASIPIDKETEQPKPASDDDGKRRVYVKYQMIRAVADALTRQGGDALLQQGLQVGGKLGVRKIGEQDLGGGNSMFEYDAVYTPPVKAAGGEAFAQAAAQAEAAAATTPPVPPAPPAANDPWSAAPAAPAASDNPWGAAPSSTDEPPF